MIRFESFNNKKNTKIKEKRTENLLKEREEEDRVIANYKKMTRKASNDTIKKSGQRMYLMAQKNKLKLEVKKTEIEEVEKYYHKRGKSSHHKPCYTNYKTTSQSKQSPYKSEYNEREFNLPHKDNKYDPNHFDFESARKHIESKIYN